VQPILWRSSPPRRLATGPGFPLGEADRTHPPRHRHRAQRCPAVPRASPTPTPCPVPRAPCPVPRAPCPVPRAPCAPGQARRTYTPTWPGRTYTRILADPRLRPRPQDPTANPQPQPPPPPRLAAPRPCPRLDHPCLALTRQSAPRATRSRASVPHEPRAHEPACPTSHALTSQRAPRATRLTRYRIPGMLLS
jgi:hypothetical protein